MNNLLSFTTGEATRLLRVSLKSCRNDENLGKLTALLGASAGVTAPNDVAFPPRPGGISSPPREIGAAKTKGSGTPDIPGRAKKSARGISSSSAWETLAPSAETTAEGGTAEAPTGEAEESTEEELGSSAKTNPNFDASRKFKL